MKHFENNILDGQSTVEAINDLNELSGAVSVNALMVAEGECEPSKTDAGAWWSLIALAEAALSRFPEGGAPRGLRAREQECRPRAGREGPPRRGRAGGEAHREHHLLPEGGLAMLNITTQSVSAHALFKQSTIKGDEAVLQFTVRMDSENAFPLMKKTGGRVILTVESEQKSIEIDDETGEVWYE